MASTCALNADGSKFAVVDDNRLKVYATATGALLVQCVEPKHVAAYVCMCWAPKVPWIGRVFFLRELRSIPIAAVLSRDARVVGLCRCLTLVAGLA